MTATEDFIFGRLDDLGLITTGWHYMHQTMSPEDRRGFEKMINMPGFSVEKFENDFLANKINPFEANSPRKTTNMDRNNAQRQHDKITALLELKSQVNGYFQKYGDPLENLLDSLLSVLGNQQRSQNVDVVREPHALKAVPYKEINTPKKDIVRGPTAFKANSHRKFDGFKKDAQKTSNSTVKEVYRGPIVLKANSPKKYHVPKKEAQKEPNVPNVDAEKKPDALQVDEEKESNVPKANTLEESAVPKKEEKHNTPTVGPLRSESFPSLEPLSESSADEHHQEQIKITYANTVKKHIPEASPQIVPKKDSPPVTALAVEVEKITRQEPTSPTIQSAVQSPLKPETIRKAENSPVRKPASPKAKSVINNSETPRLESPKTESVASNPETPSLLSPFVESDVVSIGNSRSVGSPDSSMISDVPELKPRTKKPDDPEKWTGRDGRRYRKEKRRAEEMAQALLKVEEAATENLPEDKSANHTPTGKEKRRLKDKLRKEKKAEELLHGNSLTEQPVVVQEETPVVEPEKEVRTEKVVTTEQVTETDQIVKTEQVVENEEEVGTEKVVTEEILRTEPVVETELVVTTEPIEETKLEETTTTVEETVEETLSVEPIPASEEPIPIVEPVAATSSIASPQKLEIYKYKAVAKKSGKTKKGKSKKETSLVIDHKKTSHTVDLIPGEYQIVKVDRNDDSGALPNADLNKSVQKMKNCAVSSTSPNCFIPDDISRNVLDTGKWLAYVIDDKDPHNPKIGEVSTNDVADTIAHFEARQTASDIAMLTNSRYTRTNVPDMNVADTPRMDAESVRKILSNMKLSNHLEPVPSVIDVTDVEDGVDDLTAFLNAENSDVVVFRTEFAQKTAPLFAANDKFKEFCRKYASSKYTSTQIGKLINRYIDKRIVFHYEMFEMRGDQESCRIAKSWTLVNEPTPYVFMIMMYLNSPTSCVHYYQLEKALFPQPTPFL